VVSQAARLRLRICAQQSGDLGAYGAEDPLEVSDGVGEHSVRGDVTGKGMSQQVPIANEL